MSTNTGGTKTRIHFSGIGGTAMVAGARLAIELGCEVRGSDNPLYPPTSTMVEALGVPVATGYRAENLDWQPDLVVIGNALSRGNAEVEAALERRTHYVSLAEWLKDAVLRSRRPVAICGTHGKTTTTALTAWVLECAGQNPGYLIGGQPLGFENPARLGPEGGPFVIEGDEYDTAFFDKRAKFFHYLPEIAVVTSVEFDHGDIYRDLDEIVRAFRLMLRQIPRNGWLVACADDPGAADLVPHAFCSTATYGFAEGADWRIVDVAPGEAGMMEMTIKHGGAAFGRFAVPMAGRHNMQNAAAAIAVAATLGAPADAIADGLRRFPGVRRRMEVFHEARGVTFVDDFAHHPTAIRETIAAAHMRWPGRTIRVVFEPRSNTTVTNRFRDDLCHALAGGDEVWIGPIHRAESIAVNERLDRDTVAQCLSSAGTPTFYTDEVADIVDHLAKTARPGDVILILSNGAFGGIYAMLKEAVA